MMMILFSGSEIPDAKPIFNPPAQKGKVKILISIPESSQEYSVKPWQVPRVYYPGT
jgi:hypothetical protein